MAGEAVRGCALRAAGCARRAGGRGGAPATVGRIILGALIAFALLGAAEARGNPYVVHICDGAGGYRVNSIAYASTGTMGAYTGCPADGGGHRVGLETRSAVPGAGQTIYSPPGSYAFAQLNAPAGTDIRHLESNVNARSVTNVYQARLFATMNGFTNWSSGTWHQLDCDPGCNQHYAADWGPGMNGLRWDTTCAFTWGCNAQSTGAWPYAPGYMFVNDAQVTLEDYWDPALSNGRGNLWNANALAERQTEPRLRRLRQHRHLVGIRRRRRRSSLRQLGRAAMRLHVDPAVQTTGRGRRDRHALAERRCAHGAHLALDASGRVASMDHRFYVDNHAPGEAWDAAVAGGEGGAARTTSRSTSTTPTRAPGPRSTPRTTRCARPT